jgi:hypothetical protein
MPYLGSEKNKADKASWQRKWRKNNSDKARKAWDKGEKENISDPKASKREYHLRSYFFIPEERYQELLQDQHGVCSVCKQPPTEKDILVPDHDHSCCPSRKTCGKCVRGLIHRTGNSGLGLFKDDPKILKMAAQYLEKYNALEKPSTGKMGE